MSRVHCLAVNPPLPEDLNAQGAALRRLAVRLVDDPEAADDVVQEAWVRALERPPREPGAVRGWMRRVVRGLSVDTLRSRARRRRVERPLGDLQPTDRDTVEGGLDLQIGVLEAVRALPEPYRTTVWRRYFDDAPPRAIAARDGLPVKTVKTRLHRGLAMLRERLDADHGGRRAAWLLPLAGFARPESLGCASRPRHSYEARPTAGWSGRWQPDATFG